MQLAHWPSEGAASALPLRPAGVRWNLRRLVTKYLLARSAPAGHAKLRVDMLEVLFDRVPADEEALGYLGYRQPLAEQISDLQLSTGKT